MTDQLERFIAAWRAKHVRSAWRPVVEPAGVDGPAGIDGPMSWFGGEPLVEKGFEWPCCGECKEPMRFMLQLDLSQLPSGMPVAGESGLLQLFYCATDDGMCETWMPFGEASFARLLQPADGLTCEAGTEPFPCKVIGEWQEFADAPHPAEFQDLGLSISYDFDAQTASVTCADPAADLGPLDLEVAERISTAAADDKLGGWPCWVQGVEYPRCPTCGSVMSLVFQLDSENNLPYMFGDVGCGYLTQCQDHPDQLGFGWACG
ncbi:MAG: DUF1963 domain-containing protein [Planctomycetota bacterium]